MSDSQRLLAQLESLKSRSDRLEASPRKGMFAFLHKRRFDRHEGALRNDRDRLRRVVDAQATKATTSEEFSDIGRAYFLLDMPKEAMVYLKKASHLEPASLHPYLRQAEVYESENKFLETAKSMERALTRAKLDGNAEFLILFRIARAYYARDWDQAIINLRRCLDLRPSVSLILSDLALALAHRGRTKDLTILDKISRQAGYRVSKRFSDNPDPWQNDREEAISRAQNALELDPNNVAALDTLAFIACRWGSGLEAWEKAHDLIMRAQKIDKDYSPSAHLLKEQLSLKIS